MKKEPKIKMRELNEWKTGNDLNTLREAVRIEEDRQRMKRVRKMVREEINELAYAASLHVEISR
jgi:hypothetical protein